MAKLCIDQDRWLYYRLIPGDTARPYLVFLHEGLGCTALWQDFPELLCRMTGCPGLLYDRLGYGQSSPANHARTVHYLHRYALEELPDLLDRVIPGKPFLLVGHSDGGSISLIFGAERPPLLRGIITEAAHVFVDQDTIAGITLANSAWAAGKLGGLARYHGAKTASVFKAWADTWLAAWFRHWNIEYLLPSIEAPLLVLQGEGDQYGRREQADAIGSQVSGFVRLEILADCGHAPHQEAQGVVLGLMAEFIAQVTEEAEGRGNGGL